MNVRWRVVLLSKRLYAYKIILRSWWLAEMSKLTTACLSLLSQITVRIHVFLPRFTRNSLRSSALLAEPLRLRGLGVDSQHMNYARAP